MTLPNISRIRGLNDGVMPFNNKSAYWIDGGDNTAFILGAGNLITAARDKSPEGNHPTQATGSLQPSLIPAVRNGKSVIRWDGSRYLTYPNNLFSLPNADNTVLAVSKRNTETGSAEYLSSFTEGGSVRHYMRYSATSGNFIYNNNTAATGGISAMSNINTDYQIIVAQKIGSNQFVSVNGKTVFTNANAANESGIDGGQMGALVAGGFFNGDICEFAMWRYGMSAYEIALLQIFMSKKWNVPLYI